MRRLERTAPIAVPAGVGTSLLAPPAGHKYEVIELSVAGALPAGARFFDYVTIAGVNYTVGQTALAVAGDVALRTQHPGLVIYAGQGYGVVPLGAVAFCTGFVSYIDVTFTD